VFLRRLPAEAVPKTHVASHDEILQRLLLLEGVDKRGAVGRWAPHASIVNLGIAVEVRMVRGFS
jgi:hypothetical protein